MNEAIMNACGFKDRVKLKREGKCTMCEKGIDKSKFRDKLSEREYEISGLCQECQDDIFKEG